MAWVLRACAPHADLQHAAAARRRPTWRNRTISRRKCTHNHVLQASFTAQRSSPAQQPRARPEVSIVNKRKNRCKCHVSCQFANNARTCDDRYAAAPAHHLNNEMEGAEDLGPGMPSGGSSHSLPAEQPARFSGEGVVIASYS